VTLFFLTVAQLPTAPPCNTSFRRQNPSPLLAASIVHLNVIPLPPEALKLSSRVFSVFYTADDAPLFLGQAEPHRLGVPQAPSSRIVHSPLPRCPSPLHVTPSFCSPLGQPTTPTLVAVSLPRACRSFSCSVRSPLPEDDDFDPRSARRFALGPPEGAHLVGSFPRSSSLLPFSRRGDHAFPFLFVEAPSVPAFRFCVVFASLPLLNSLLRRIPFFPPSANLVWLSFDRLYV